MAIVKLICDILSGAFFALSIYKYIYLLIGFFVKPKVFAKAAADKKYGVIIAARNEETVIGKLLESLNAQTYPKELIKIFVVADNCTDKTAQISRSHGAVVYERFEPERARKGYALNFLFEQIEKDYGITSFDGYLFFDADNVVKTDYIEQMNNAFHTDVDAVVGYRNAKNLSQNLISAGYGFHFLRCAVAYNRPRSVLSLSTHISGTGFMLSSKLLEDGWHFEFLTEDTQATLELVCSGKKIEYCEAAELYDEQPTNLRVMVRQRMRWAKGRLACFLAHAGKLVKGIFTAKGRRFSCYDMLFYVMPNSLIVGAIGTIEPIVSFLKGLSEQGTAYLQPEGDITKSLNTLAISLLVSYSFYVINGALIVIRERKHIICPLPKLILYVLACPWYDVTNIPITVASLFMHITWKPIKHDSVIDINEIENAK